MPTFAVLRRAAYGDQNFVGFLLLRLGVGVGPGNHHAGVGLLDLFYLAADVYVDAAFLEEPCEFLGDLFVLDGNRARQVLENRDLRAEAAEDGAEFHAHGARADHDQRLGRLAHRQDFDVGEDAVVGLLAEERARFGASRENNILRLELPGFAVRSAGQFHRVHAVFCRAGRSAVTGNYRHLVLLHQELESLGVLGDDGALALLHRGPVELRRPDTGDAVVGRVLQVVPDLGVEKQGLGRNAAHVQAGAAEHGRALDERDLQAVLPAANGRRVARRPAANDCHVVQCVCQNACSCHGVRLGGNAACPGSV